MIKSAQYWIDKLELLAHPEGGFYKETYASEETITSQELSVDFEGKRKLATSIYFLIRSGEASHLHRLKSDELWYYHYGCALTVYSISPEGQLHEYKIGPNLEAGETLQAIIPAGHIFGSTVNEPDSYTMVGCMVTPGFDFQDFELNKKADLMRDYPQHEAIINRLAIDA